VVVGVTSVVVLSGLVGELLGGSSLGAGVQVLDLGLAENAGQGSGPSSTEICFGNLHVGVAVGGLVHFGVVDHEEDLPMSVSTLNDPSLPNSSPARAPHNNGPGL
jgi:hypothetical protein